MIIMLTSALPQAFSSPPSVQPRQSFVFSAPSSLGPPKPHPVYLYKERVPQSDSALYWIMKFA